MKTTPGENADSGNTDLLAPPLHESRIRKTLKRITFLRSGVHFVLELKETLREERAQQGLEQLFDAQSDPWCFESSSSEHQRFARQTAMLDSIADGNQFASGLEIGCAEGWYTLTLAERCESLLAMDLSPTALARARGRREWPDRVRFAHFDLRRESLPGTFDLIVIAAVLEYMPNPLTLRRVRQKLVNALRPGGYLMVETTRKTGAAGLLESSWWSRWLLRGKWINQFIMNHPLLHTVRSVESDWYVITLCRKEG